MRTCFFFSFFIAYLEQKLTEMLTDGNEIATPSLITQENDNQLVEIMTKVEPMIVTDPIAEDSGIQTATESPASESHSDSVEVIQSDDSAKNGKLYSK